MYHALAVFHIYLVSKDNEREIVRIFRCCVYEELVSPRINGIEGFSIVDVVNQDAAISATVECNSKTLESFLTSSIP